MSDEKSRGRGPEYNDYIECPYCLEHMEFQFRLDDTLHFRCPRCGVSFGYSIDHYLLLLEKV